MNASRLKIGAAVVALALVYAWLFRWAHFLIYIEYWRRNVELCRDSGSFICDAVVQAISFLCALVLALPLAAVAYRLSARRSVELTCLVVATSMAVEVLRSGVTPEGASALIGASVILAATFIGSVLFLKLGPSNNKQQRSRGAASGSADG